jgi:hypothetical protein
MNQVTTLYTYIKSLGEADSYVSTITKNATNDILQNKATIFPLLNIAITSVSYSSQQIKTFSLEISCFNKRDQNKETVNDIFWENDNEVDNMNETEACLNRIWLIMERNFDKNNITANENPTLNPVLEGTTSLIDGWVMTLDVNVPNIDICL